VPASHFRTVNGQRAGESPELTLRRAQWLRTGLVGWDLPLDAAGFPGAAFRLHHADRGGLEVAAEAVTGGPSIPLTVDPAGLPAEVRADWPHLAAYGALPPSAMNRSPAASTATARGVLRCAAVASPPSPSSMGSPPPEGPATVVITPVAASTRRTLLAAPSAM